MNYDLSYLILNYINVNELIQFFLATFLDIQNINSYLNNKNLLLIFNLNINFHILMDK